MLVRYVTLKKRSFFNNVVFVITSFCKALFAFVRFAKRSFALTVSEHQLRFCIQYFYFFSKIRLAVNKGKGRGKKNLILLKIKK